MSAEEQKTTTDAPTEGQTPAPAAKEGKEVVLGEDGKPLSKGELKKRAKEAESEYRGYLSERARFSLVDGFRSGRSWVRYCICGSPPVPSSQDPQPPLPRPRNTWLTTPQTPLTHPQKQPKQPKKQPKKQKPRRRRLLRRPM